MKEHQNQTFSELKPVFVEEHLTDPFLQLGFGLLSYRTTLRILSVAFLVMSLIALPIIIMYS